MAMMNSMQGDAKERFMKLKAKVEKGEIMSAEAREEYNRLRPLYDQSSGV
jgi:hypothetical protein